MRKELGMELDPEKIRQNAYKRIQQLEDLQLLKFRDILIHEVQHAIQDQEGFAQGGSVSSSGYNNLAGEVEARNATRRSRMSEEEKRQSLLSDTADVAEESQIYIFDGDGKSFWADGRYFEKWQDVIVQFKKDLEGVELNQEQRNIYDVVIQQKDKVRLRIDDLNELEDIFVNLGTRKKGVKKLISVHYAGLRNPVTALEVLNIGDVIRRGKLAEEGTEEHPDSRRYELQAEDGAMLKVIIDFYGKHDKNKSVINFYSDRKSNTGAHAVSSGIITDLGDNISQNPENASGDLSDELRFSLDEYSESEQDDIVAVLQPFVGRNIDMEPEKYREYLKNKDIRIPDEDADLFFRLAVLANEKAARDRFNKARDQWIFENFPLFSEVAEFAGVPLLRPAAERLKK